MRRRPNRDRCCAGKQKLKKREAISLVKQMRREKGMALSAYECPRCRYWHLGSTRPRLPAWAWGTVTADG